jgi:hypothetical protein
MQYTMDSSGACLRLIFFYSQLTMCFYVVRTGLEGRVTRVADRGSFVRADAILLRAQGQVSFYSSQ